MQIQGDSFDDSDNNLNNNNSNFEEFIPTFLKIKQILLLKYNDFVKLLEEFNQILKTFTTDETDFLEFSIVNGSDRSSLFWKAVIRIKCTRISKIGNCIENQAILNLHQFLSVHQSLMQQMSTLKCVTPGSGNDQINTNPMSELLKKYIVT